MENRTRKNVEFSELDLERIKKIKIEQHIKTDIGAIRFALEQYDIKRTQEDAEQRIAKIVANNIMDQMYPYSERLKWATRTAEQNSILLLDAMNSLLIHDNIVDCVPVDTIMSPVIQSSKEKMNERIAYFKQKKDDRINKANHNDVKEDDLNEKGEKI